MPGLPQPTQPAASLAAQQSLNERSPDTGPGVHGGPSRHLLPCLGRVCAAEEPRLQSTPTGPFHPLARPSRTYTDPCILVSAAPGGVGSLGPDSGSSLPQTRVDVQTAQKDLHGRGRKVGAEATLGVTRDARGTGAGGRKARARLGQGYPGGPRSWAPAEGGDWEEGHRLGPRG